MRHAEGSKNGDRYRLYCCAMGTLLLLACADDLKVVTEKTETNNCKAAVTRVQITP